MTLRLPLLLAACGLLAAPCAHAAPRSVDARTLDIAGVRTGMDLDEARAAMARHFGVAPEAIKADPFPGENIVTHTRLPSYLSFKKDGEEMTVHFEGRVPPDPAHPLAVSQVGYEVPWSQANSADMAKAAVAKYGTPSNAPNTLPMQWCQKPSDNTGLGCMAEQAKLELSQVRLSLVDPAWTKARIGFVEESKATKPRF